MRRNTNEKKKETTENKNAWDWKASEINENKKLRKKFQCPSLVKKMQNFVRIAYKLWNLEDVA